MWVFCHVARGRSTALLCATRILAQKQRGVVFFFSVVAQADMTASFIKPKYRSVACSGLLNVVYMAQIYHTWLVTAAHDAANSTLKQMKP